MTGGPRRVGVAFGGRSVEHDVSIITGLQAAENLPPAWRPVALYLDRDGRCWTGPALLSAATYRAGDPTASPGAVEVRLERGGWLAPVTARPRRRWRTPAPTLPGIAAVLPALHGTYGEDGTFQGLLEMLDLPYAGCGVAASAIANDKLAAKRIWRAAGLPVASGTHVTLDAFAADREGELDRIAGELDGTVVVKPARLGSSVGVGRAESRTERADALDLALTYDAVALVERMIGGDGGAVEYNVALRTVGGRAEASEVEQPVATAGLLSFEDKYLRGGGGGQKSAGKGTAPPAKGPAKGGGMKSMARVVPADIPAERRDRVRALGLAAFAAVGGEGLARCDLLYDPARDELIVNELNTLPGSFAFYLWEPTGVPFAELLGTLLDEAALRAAGRRVTTYAFDSSLLATTGAGKA